MPHPAAHAKQHRYHSTPTQSVDDLYLTTQQTPTKPSRNLKKPVHSFKQVYRRLPYLYKRKDSPYWWYKLPAIRGETRPLQGSTKTTNKKQAQAFLNKLALDRWNIAHLGVKPTYLWEEAADRWLRETSHKRTHKDDCDKIRILHPYLGGKALRDINCNLIDQIKYDKLKTTRPSGVNRYLALIRSILRKARDE